MVSGFLVVKTSKSDGQQDFPPKSGLDWRQWENRSQQTGRCRSWSWLQETRNVCSLEWQWSRLGSLKLTQEDFHSLLLGIQQHCTYSWFHVLLFDSNCGLKYLWIWWQEGRKKSWDCILGMRMDWRQYRKPNSWGSTQRRTPRMYRWCPDPSVPEFEGPRGPGLVLSKQMSLKTPSRTGQWGSCRLFCWFVGGALADPHRNCQSKPGFSSASSSHQQLVSIRNKDRITAVCYYLLYRWKTFNALIEQKTFWTDIKVNFERLEMSPGLVINGFINSVWMFQLA